MTPLVDTSAPPDARVAESVTPGGLAARTWARARALPRRTVFWIAAIDVVLVLGFGLLSKDHSYLSVANFQNVGLDSAQIVLLSAGEALLLGAGLLDISLGATLILSSVVGGKVIVALSGSAAQTSAGRYPHLGIAVAVGIVSCLAIGAIVGLVNGLVVTRLRVNSLITTLAMMGIATGAADLPPTARTSPTSRPSCRTTSEPRT